MGVKKSHLNHVRGILFQTEDYEVKGAKADAALFRQAAKWLEEHPRAVLVSVSFNHAMNDDGEEQGRLYLYPDGYGPGYEGELT